MRILSALVVLRKWNLNPLLFSKQVDLGIISILNNKFEVVVYYLRAKKFATNSKRTHSKSK